MAHQDQHQSPEQAGIAPQPAVAGAARRRFLRRGAATAAAGALTLTSQPGMATIICTTPSANASFLIFKSARPTNTVTCQGGRSPGYYSTHLTDWWGSCGPNTLFNNVFKCYSGNARSKNLINKKLSYVVTATQCPASSDPNRVAMHIIAAYQNALKGETPFLQPGQVMAIWNAYASTGYFKPLGASSTTTWNGAQIVAYLTGTQI